MMIENMDISAALYSALVMVNPMMPSAGLELFAVVEMSSKFKVVAHLLFNEVVISKLYSVSGKRSVILMGGLFLNLNSISSSEEACSTVPFWFYVKLSERSSLLDLFASFDGSTWIL